MAVLLVDAHEILRAALRSLLDAAADVAVVAEAGSGGEALAALDELDVDVVAVRTPLPGQPDAAELVRAVRRRPDRCPCLAVVSGTDRQVVPALVRAGVAGYLTAERQPGELVLAIRTLATGGSLIDAEELQRLAFEDLNGETRRRAIDQLSAQEKRVMELAVEGLTNRQIGERLHLSTPTVRNYLSSVLHKLGVQNRTELAVVVSRSRRLR